jgi:hypothetical protein
LLAQLGLPTFAMTISFGASTSNAIERLCVIQLEPSYRNLGSRMRKLHPPCFFNLLEFRHERLGLLG